MVLYTNEPPRLWIDRLLWPIVSRSLLCVITMPLLMLAGMIDVVAYVPQFVLAVSIGLIWGTTVALVFMASHRRWFAWKLWALESVREARRRVVYENVTWIN